MENGMALEGIAAVAFSALFYVAMILVSRRFFVTRLRFARDRRVFDVKFGRDMLRKFLFLGYARRFRQEGLLWLYGFFLADVACVLLAFAAYLIALFGPPLPALASAARVGFILAALLTIAPPFIVRFSGKTEQRGKRRH